MGGGSPHRRLQSELHHGGIVAGAVTGRRRARTTGLGLHQGISQSGPEGIENVALEGWPILPTDSRC